MASAAYLLEVETVAYIGLPTFVVSGLAVASAVVEYNFPAVTSLGRHQAVISWWWEKRLLFLSLLHPYWCNSIHCSWLVLCLIIVAGRGGGVVFLLALLVTVASHASDVCNGLLTVESDTTLEVTAPH